MFASRFNVSEEQLSKSAIAFAFGRFYVFDTGCSFTTPCGVEGRAFAYAPDGRRQAEFDFTLGLDVSLNGAIHAEGLLYTVGVSYQMRERVFVYSETGERIPEAEFELEDNWNYNPRDITYVDGLFYVVDSGQEDRSPPRPNKVYAYTKAGVRVPSADVDLGLPHEAFAHEIEYVDSLFHVGVILRHDTPDVFVYRPDGERVATVDFPRTFYERGHNVRQWALLCAR